MNLLGGCKYKIYKMTTSTRSLRNKIFFCFTWFIYLFKYTPKRHRFRSLKACQAESYLPINGYNIIEDFGKFRKYNDFTLIKQFCRKYISVKVKYTKFTYAIIENWDNTRTNKNTVLYHLIIYWSYYHTCSFGNVIDTLLISTIFLI